MEFIEHKGVVEKTEGDCITVKITSQSACAACHAKSACTISGSTDKFIDVYSSQKLEPGNEVMIIGTQGQGFKAAWLAYVLPVILVMATLIITYAVSGNEVLSGIMALAILIPYFLVLKRINDGLKRTFSFNIRLINE